MPLASWAELEVPCCCECVFRVVFTMGRTLSIGDEGSRAVEFAFDPVCLGWNPRSTARVRFDARSAV